MLSRKIRYDNLEEPIYVDFVIGNLYKRIIRRRRWNVC